MRGPVNHGLVLAHTEIDASIIQKITLAELS